MEFTVKERKIYADLFRIGIGTIDIEGTGERGH